MSDLDMLAALITEATPSPAPSTKKLYGEWHSFLIGIGADHTAEILIDDESLAELLRRTQGETE